MSNHKRAFGWVGHIITRDDEASHEHNVVKVSDKVFERIMRAQGDSKLDLRIQAKQLGVTYDDDGVFYLATGVHFSTGFDYYGTIFKEAELRSRPGSMTTTAEAQYMQAMKEIYGLELPPPRFMVGCSSEN